MTSTVRPSAMPPASPDPKSAVWWRHPMVWLIIGGPAIVVVASFVTLGLALKYPDPVLENNAASADAGDARATALVPALQGRNQAAAVAVRPQTEAASPTPRP